MMINHGNNTVNINMFKLVILGNAANPHIQRWGAYFVKRKYDVHIISFHESIIPGAKVHFIQPPKFLYISPVTAFWRKVGYLLIILKIRRQIHTLNPDILHAHWATSYGLVGAISGYHPFIISTWGRDIFDSPKQSWIMKKIVEFNLSKADSVTATSTILQKETLKYTKNRKTVHYIPFGIDTKVFSPIMKQNKSEFIVIGTVKALEEKYGIYVLINAFAQLRNNIRNIKLLIVGEGSLYNDLLKLVNELGLTEFVTFTGFISNNEVINYFHQIDIFVVPSISPSETFGVAAIEASACGIPVIASHIGGLPEVVKDHKTGFLITPGDVDTLAEKISELITNPVLRIEMGKNGRQFILSRYTIEKCGSQMESIYSKYTNKVSIKSDSR